jgi:hypothetical protein
VTTKQCSPFIDNPVPEHLYPKQSALTMRTTSDIQCLEFVVLQETVASATSLATSLKGELAEGQRNLVALAENASASAVHNSHIAKQMNIPDKVIISHSLPLKLATSLSVISRFPHYIHPASFSSGLQTSKHIFGKSSNV